MIRKLSILLPLLFIATAACAQSRRAQREYQDARSSVANGNYQEALEHINKSVESSEDYAEAWLFKADIHTYLGEGDEMMTSYAKAVEFGMPMAVYFRWTDAALRLGYYAEADSLIQIYLDSDELNSRYAGRAHKMKETAQFALAQIAHPVPFEPQWLGEMVNTMEMQYFPSVSGDGKTLVFTGRNMNVEPMDEDFYATEKVDGEWTRSQRLEGFLNTTGNEGAQSLSADGNYIFFAGCNREGGFGSCDIYVSKKLSDGTWAAPFNLGGNINTRFWESQPTISADGKTLLFVRGGNGSGDKGDIFESHLVDGRWTRATKLQGDVNTEGGEASPFLHFDGKTLYFSSNGHTGMGQEDLFVAHKDENGNWTDIQNLGYPINTFQDEFSLAVAPDGKTAYYASDRGNEADHLELYQFELPEEVRALPVAWIDGIVVEEVSSNPVKASLSFVDLETGEEVLSDENASDGTFYVSLPSGGNYAVNVTSPGYLFYSETINLKDQTDATDEYVEIVLKPIVSGESAVLKNVFFEYDSFELQNPSKIELNRLVGFMELNPDVKIRVDGHTDDEGNAAYNAKLSLDRAEAVKQYLVSQGVSEGRVQVKGFGATVPIADNSTEEGRALNRRTEFTIL
ncbi:MAG: flagellar motor protein MotB [Bacteroidetes bacterium]|nr:MAG: flagellar motor protein MotB [Bacteroidota bacterium]